MQSIPAQQQLRLLLGDSDFFQKIFSIRFIDKQTERYIDTIEEKLKYITDIINSGYQNQRWGFKMKGKQIFALGAVILLISISFVTTVESNAVQEAFSGSIDDQFDQIKHTFPSINKSSVFERIRQQFLRDENQILDQLLPNAVNVSLNKVNLTEFFSSLIGNFSSFDVIAALFGSLLFLLATQPLFLQFAVENSNQYVFVIILISLFLVESLQKVFALKIVGFWDQYVKNDVDGFWNFFSIVFFSSYVKIYLSYLPTFIIQYSNVFTKAFFYGFMFALPILFNVCIADSIDMIDWNRDEWGAIISL